MARNTFHPVRRRIVYFSSQPLLCIGRVGLRRVAEIAHLAAPLLGWSNTCTQPGRGLEAAVAHAQRFEDIQAREFVERQTADAAHDFAECNVTNVAIDKPGARRITQWLCNQSLDRFVVTGPTFAQIEVRLITRAMR